MFVLYCILEGEKIASKQEFHEQRIYEDKDRPGLRQLQSYKTSYEIAESRLNSGFYYV